MEFYQVPAVNMWRLKCEIGKLNKRAARLKRDPIELTVHRSYTETERDSLGFDYERKYYEVSIDGETPQASGWSLIAVLEPRKNEQNLVREVPGHQCPVEYRHTDTHCDHCQTKARRKKLYVLQHEDGQFQQVGSSCLGDFLGCDSPQQIVADAERLMTFSGLCGGAQDRDWGFGNETPVVETTRFATVAATVIRCCGWLPKSKAFDDERPTASIAWDLCLYQDIMEPVIQRHNIEVTPADAEKAEKALDWARAIDPDSAQNSFLHNLGVACREDYVDPSTSGTVAALFIAYDRNVQDNQEMPVNSQHVGEPKQCLVFDDVILRSCRLFESKFGLQTHIRFEDKDGNILYWRASGKVDWLPQVGEKLTIKTTIKQHDEWKGIKETHISRAVLEEDT